MCFQLLPEKFTLHEMQQLYEFAFGLELDKANFRKKIKPIPLISLNEKQKNVKHRPANLFAFDSKKFEALIKDESFSFRM